ncbi:hypothetical protein Q1695_007887 [Nippostrongylus brasiliensis]|nr:hypothetical protein Q1695_007887 [Nippostrongylus brasiliensis]
MDTAVFLVVDVIILVLQAGSLTCTTVVVIMFIKVKELRQRPSLRLALFLTSSHFVFDVVSLPYVIYLACNWRADFLDMDPYIIMILSVGLPIQLKIKLTLTIAIAVERALALFTPFIYRRICLCTYALAFFLIAITLAAIDISIEFAVSPFKRVINCDSIGCFVGEKYLNYWGVSNMVMGMIVDCLTLLVLVKLKAMRQPRPHKNSTSKVVPKKLNQANRTSVGILVSSFVFITVPSVAVGVVNMCGYPIFDKIGPFYTPCLLTTGIFDCTVYVFMNKELRAVVKRILRGMDPCASTTEQRVFHMQVATSK